MVNRVTADLQFISAECSACPLFQPFCKRAWVKKSTKGERERKGKWNGTGRKKRREIISRIAVLFKCPIFNHQVLQQRLNEFVFINNNRFAHLFDKVHFGFRTRKKKEIKISTRFPRNKIIIQTFTFFFFFNVILIPIRGILFFKED